jgi:hypothetical protein
MDTNKSLPAHSLSHMFEFIVNKILFLFQLYKRNYSLDANMNKAIPNGMRANYPLQAHEMSTEL